MPNGYLMVQIKGECDSFINVAFLTFCFYFNINVGRVFTSFTLRKQEPATQEIDAVNVSTSRGRQRLCK